MVRVVIFPDKFGQGKKKGFSRDVQDGGDPLLEGRWPGKGIEQDYHGHFRKRVADGGIG